jgi:hypothetical protein
MERLQNRERNRPLRPRQVQLASKCHHRKAKVLIRQYAPNASANIRLYNNQQPFHNATISLFSNISRSILLKCERSSAGTRVEWSTSFLLQ